MICSRRSFLFQSLFWPVLCTLPARGKGTSQSTGSITYDQSFGEGLDKHAVLIFKDHESLYYFQRNNRKRATLKEIFAENEDNIVDITLDIADQEGICFYLNRRENEMISRIFDFFSSE